MRLVCAVSVAVLSAAAWVAAGKDAAVNPAVPRSTRSKTSSPVTDGHAVQDAERYHWLITRDGRLARGLSDVEDPDELSRYSEFDVAVTQRRRRRKRRRPSSGDDVIGSDLNTSASQPAGQRLRI